MNCWKNKQEATSGLPDRNILYVSKRLLTWRILQSVLFSQLGSIYKKRSKKPLQSERKGECQCSGTAWGPARGAALQGNLKKLDVPGWCVSETAFSLLQIDIQILLPWALPHTNEKASPFVPVHACVNYCIQHVKHNTFYNSHLILPPKGRATTAATQHNYPSCDTWTHKAIGI